MKIGLTLPHLGSIARRENIIRLAEDAEAEDAEAEAEDAEAEDAEAEDAEAEDAEAEDAEAEGFDSLWVAERLLWPLNPQTPYQPTPDDSLPTFYQNVFDPSGDAHLCGCKYRENCPWNVCNRHVLP
jgi:hypothetical protein